MYTILFFSVVSLSILYILRNCYYAENIYRKVDLLNDFFSAFCHDPAVLNPQDFPWTKNFRENYRLILSEYLNYGDKNIPKHASINDHVSSCDKTGSWRTLYLRAFGKDTNVAQKFPQTMKLINSCPCTLAFFSVLEPGAKLEPHYGVYKGVIRYHLGLIVPDDWENCSLHINEDTLHWREGADIMFDDLFLHHVENNTDQCRVVLFLDIKRDFRSVFLNLLNSLFLRFIKSNDALKDTIDNVNRLDYLRQ